MSSAAELLFSQLPLAGAPALVFGDSDAAPVPPVAPSDPRALVFRELVADIEDIRALVFGADDAPPAVIADVTLQAAGQISGLRGRITLRTAAVVQAAGVLSGLRGHISLRTAVVLRAAGQITGLRGHVLAHYDINLTRYLHHAPASVKNTAIQSAQTGTGSSWGTSARELGGTSARWQRASSSAKTSEAAHRTSVPRQSARSAGWQLADRCHAQASACHQRADSLARSVQGAHQLALALQAARDSRMQTAVEWRLTMAGDWQAARAVGLYHRGRLGASLQRKGRQADVGRWQIAMHPLTGRSTPPVPPTLPPCYTPDPRLVFDAPWAGSAALVFVCERQAAAPVARIVIPILRTYVTINSISLHRVDTGAELHAHGFSMSLDADSWTWSWSASLHYDAANHLGRDAQGDPAELAVFVNGIPFRLRLGQIQRDRRFNPTRWAVSGKGKAAILGAPYAPRMSFGNTAPRTARQLMDDVLTVNGVSLGWTVDWGLTDWLVPEGAWALQGSYIEAINDIAAAAGGYVQPHPTDAVLRVLPRYPAAPWAWDSIAPDFEIPADAAEVEGTQYVDKPAYNRVFVGGVGAGVFGPFKRAGTAGDLLAPQVTHALITHADAHRQRGLAELSDTGQQEHITLKMQVLPETGIITPGQFVRYLGDKTVIGIVRSTSIDWSRPVLRQTLGIETHA